MADQEQKDGTPPHSSADRVAQTATCGEEYGQTVPAEAFERTVSSDSSPGAAPGPMVGRAPAIGARYEFLEELGRGAFGIVYRARDRTADEEVAIKVLDPGAASSPVLLRRVHRELKAARRVTHPGVVRIHDLIDLGDRLALSMELVRGQTLQARIDQAGRLDASALIALAKDLARGLAAAHRVGVIHRDLKPANIILRASDGRAVITDFGISRLGAEESEDARRSRSPEKDPARTQEGALAGTPLYMAPEQLAGGEVGKAADVYSLGAVLFQSATGRAPHAARTVGELRERKLSEAASPLQGERPELPAPFCSLVDRCLARDVAARPSSGVELKAALEQLSGPSDVTARIQLPPGARRRRVLPLVLATMTLAALAGVGWWWSGRLPSGARRVLVELRPEAGTWLGRAVERRLARQARGTPAGFVVESDAARANVVLELDVTRGRDEIIVLSPRLGPAWGRRIALPVVRAGSVELAVKVLASLLAERMEGVMEPGAPSDEEARALVDLAAPSREVLARYEHLLVAVFGDQRLVGAAARGEDLDALDKVAPGWAHGAALRLSVQPIPTLDPRQVEAARARVQPGRDPSGDRLLDGIAAFARGDNARAVVALEALFRERSDVLAGYWLTVVHNRERRAQEEEFALRKLVELRPDLSFGRELDHILLANGRPEDVAAAAEAWLQRAPDNPLALVTLVSGRAALGRLDEAAQRAADLLLLEGPTSRALALRADVLIVAERPVEARRGVEALLRSESDGTAWHRLGDVALLEGRFGEAHEAFSKSVEVLARRGPSAELVQSWKALWLVSLETGHVEDADRSLAALERFARAVGSAVSAADFAFKRALQRRGRGRCPDPATLLAAIPPGPGRNDLRIGMVRDAASVGCAPCAEVVRGGLAVNESGVHSLLGFATCAEREGQLELARKALERCTRIRTLSLDANWSALESIRAQALLGRVLLRLGDTKGARTAFQRFLARWGTADRELAEVVTVREALAKLTPG